MKHICAEIMYNQTHSDICISMGKAGEISAEERDLLHKCLDEWLDKSQGNGIFYVGDTEMVQPD